MSEADLRTDPRGVVPPYRAVGSYEGAFSSVGKRETIVSLFPCGSAMGLEAAKGLLVLLEEQPSGWVRRSQDQGIVLPSDACKQVQVSSRAAVVCSISWGPFQGVTGESACIALAVSSRLRTACPLRLQHPSEEAEASGPTQLDGVALVPGSSGQPLLEVRLGVRIVRFDVTEKGVALTAESATGLRDDPIPGVSVEPKDWATKG